MKNDTFTKTVETIAGECLAARVRLLNRTVTNIYDDALRPLGVKVSQLNVLIVVALGGPISPGEVARQLNIEKNTKKSMRLNMFKPKMTTRFARYFPR